MLKNYFVVALRNLWRNKILSFINISGLSIGLACCMLIFLYTKDELSYDRFHEKKSQIYRLTARVVDDKGNEKFKAGKSGMIHGPSFTQGIPEIKEFVRFSSDDFVIRSGTKTFNQHIHFADENFFSVFSFPLITGNPHKVLSTLNSMVITEEMAGKFFGTIQAAGKILELQIKGKFEPFIITGVAKNPPQNSSIKFEVLLPMKFQEKINPDDHWLNFFISTFFVLNPGTDPGIVLNKITRVYHEKAKDQLKEAREKYNFHNSVYWGLQPLSQIHLSKDYAAEDELSDSSNPIYSYILTGIAIFIMLIACINFINLTIARSLKRSKEIGIRKVIGGQRVQLARQFLGESFLICFIAFVFAICLANISLPVFNAVANKRLSISYLSDWKLVSGFIALFLVTGFAAGLYPALILSGFDPVQTLYHRVKLTGKNYLARTLIVLQFALAGLLIICTFFIYAQFHFLTHTKLGYNDKGIVVVDASWDAGKDFAELFKSELLRNPSVLMAAAHNRGRQGTTAKVDGREIQFDYEHIDDKYLPTMQIPIVKGRNLSADFPSDSTGSVLINETFAREAGWKDPIGKTVDLFWRNRKFIVVGVVKDYYYRPLNEKIGSQLFTSEPEGNSSQFNIRISPRNTAQTLQYIESTFKKLSPFYPYSYNFKDEINARAYEQGEKWKQIISFSAILTIFISCIGLFGLTAMSAEQKTKEIGIRKVLGASVGSIVQLLSGNFLKLVLLANIIALPVAWWAVHEWLQNFAYHIHVHWWEFALAVLLTMTIALLTISLNAMKAAGLNPVKNLRTE
jgi:putative ABC transport system permease protein